MSDTGNSWCDVVRLADLQHGASVVCRAGLLYTLFDRSTTNDRVRGLLCP